MNDFTQAPRFAGLSPLPSKLWLSSPTMHGEEQKWVAEAIRTNWVTTLALSASSQIPDVISYRVRIL